VSFDLTVAGDPPATLVQAGSIAFTGMVNSAYSQRMLAQAYDAAGRPAPYAAVAFLAPAGAGPSLNFEQGTNLGFGFGTSLGYALAPVMTANQATGHGQVVATLLNGAASTTFDYYNSAAGVASIEALPGTTPQTTRLFALFPEVLGARVRDAIGNPVASAAVRFTVPFVPGSGYGFFLTEPGSTNEAIVMTGADGIAVGPARILATVAGSVPYTADVPGAASTVQYALTAIDAGPAHFEVVSGNNQRAIVNTTYALPWTVRAVGNDGLPFPYAPGAILGQSVQHGAERHFGRTQHPSRHGRRAGHRHRASLHC
jgi:hypothetical protein